MRVVRSARYGSEVTMVTVVLWVSMSAVAWHAMARIAAMLPPPPSGVNIEPGELPFVVLFLLLAVASHLARPVVRWLGRLSARHGW